uniref:Uncharacterized protein n=1 Tax=Arundo donax TaxID=35708 RepID=A0A0A8ZUK7_ARUDO
MPTNVNMCQFHPYLSYVTTQNHCV